MANFKKKPTIKELANVLIEVNSKVNETMNILRNLDSVFGLYVKMEGNLEKFNKFIEDAAKSTNDLNFIEMVRKQKNLTKLGTLEGYSLYDL